MVHTTVDISPEDIAIKQRLGMNWRKLIKDGMDHNTKCVERERDFGKLLEKFNETMVKLERAKTLLNFRDFEEKINKN